jgi:hypothetical protein
MVKSPQAIAIFEHVHQVLRQMLHSAEIDMLKPVTPDDVDVLLDKLAWAIGSTYHTVHKASPGVAILDEICSLTFCLWLTGTKLENTGNC